MFHNPIGGHLLIIIIYLFIVLRMAVHDLFQRVPHRWRQNLAGNVVTTWELVLVVYVTSQRDNLKTKTTQRFRHVLLIYFFHHNLFYRLSLKAIKVWMTTYGVHKYECKIIQVLYFRWSRTAILYIIYMHAVLINPSWTYSWLIVFSMCLQYRK